jgi:hypothetical protein
VEWTDIWLDRELCLDVRDKEDAAVWRVAVVINLNAERQIKVRYFKTPYSPVEDDALKDEWISVDTQTDRLAHLFSRATREDPLAIHKRQCTLLEQRGNYLRSLFNDVVKRRDENATIGVRTAAIHREFTGAGSADDDAAAAAAAAVRQSGNGDDDDDDVAICVVGDSGGGGGEVQREREIVSLCDVLTSSRIDVPVRGEDCTHVQCFDLLTHLEYNAPLVVRIIALSSDVRICDRSLYYGARKSHDTYATVSSIDRRATVPRRRAATGVVSSARPIAPRAGSSSTNTCFACSVTSTKHTMRTSQSIHPPWSPPPMTTPSTLR